jgi:hypothetical protein
MGCLIALGSAISPRVGIFLLWLFSNRLGEAFDSGWLALLGFFFLPWTTLAWAVAYQPAGGVGVSGFGWFLVAFAFLADLSTHAGSARSRTN